ncbi:MAG: hypothetical protein K2M19_08715 [Muribaculaceae bacterium]|nr:hypothetical protein [Muribaculaceae bacterium]
MSNTKKYTDWILIGLIVLSIVAIAMVEMGISLVNTTSFTKEELLWIQNKSGGADFSTQTGKSMRMEIIYSHIHNNKCSFYIGHNKGESFNHANGYYIFILSDSINMYKGEVRLSKLDANDECIVQTYLNDLYTYDPLQTLDSETVLINNNATGNCLVINESNAIHKSSDSINQQVQEYIISRDYGPIYVKLSNGVEYFREFK